MANQRVFAYCPQCERPVEADVIPGEPIRLTHMAVGPEDHVFEPEGENLLRVRRQLGMKD